MMTKRKSVITILLTIILASTIGIAVACKKENGDKKTVTLSQTTGVMGVLETLQLNATLSGGLAGEVIWSSTDESVATVTDGLISSIKPGNTKITASVTDSTGSYSAQCSIEVLEGELRPTIYLPSYSVNICLGGTMTLTPTALYGTDKEALDAVFSFESKDNNIAAVNAAGVITVYSSLERDDRSVIIVVEGTAMGYTMTSREVVVNVVDDHEIRLSSNSATLFTSDVLGGYIQTTVTAEVFVADELDAQKIVTVENSHPSVATYNQATGTLTAISEGETTIEFSVVGSLGVITSTLTVNIIIPIIEIDGTVTIGKNKAFIDLEEIESIAFIDITKVRINDTKIDSLISVSGNIANLDSGKLEVIGTISLTLIDNDKVGYKTAVKVVDFILSTAAEVKSYFNEFSANIRGLNEYIALTSDIDMSDLSDYSTWKIPYNYRAFSGTFDGQGHILKNLKLGIGGMYFTLAGGTIKDLALVNAFKGDGSLSAHSGFILASHNGAGSVLEDIFVSGVDLSVEENKAVVRSNSGTMKNIVSYIEMPNATSKNGLGHTNFSANVTDCYAVAPGATQTFVLSSPGGAIGNFYQSVLELFNEFDSNFPIGFTNWSFDRAEGELKFFDKVVMKVHALSTAQDVKNYFEEVASGSGDIDDYVIMLNNIDMSQLSDYETWNVPGNTRDFTGAFDGMGYTIKNLKVETSGIFYQIGVSGTLKNVAFVDAYKKNTTRFIVGGIYADSDEGFIIAKDNYGVIENVFVSGDYNVALPRDTFATGLIGNSTGVIKNVVIFVNVLDNVTKYGIGYRTYAPSVITDCYSVISGAAANFNNNTTDGELFQSVLELFNEFNSNFPNSFTNWNFDFSAGELRFFGTTVLSIA